MRESKFTEEQIVQTNRLAEAGTPVAELCRKIGISERTFYTIKDAKEKLGAWRKDYNQNRPPGALGKLIHAEYERLNTNKKSRRSHS